jgi:hypothetical protein
MLDNEGHEMLDREVIAVVTSSSSATATTKMEATIIEAVHIVEAVKFPATTTAGTLSDFHRDDDVCVIEKICTEGKPSAADLIVVDTISCSPATAVAAAVVTALSSFSDPCSSGTVGSQVVVEGVINTDVPDEGAGGSSSSRETAAQAYRGTESTKEVAAADWPSSSNRRAEDESDTISEYIEAC